MAELKKGCAWTWVFKLVDEYDFATPQPGRMPEVQVSRDGGGFSTTTHAPGEIGGGWYAVELTSVETDADVLVAMATATECAQADEAFYLPTQTPHSAVSTVADAVLSEAVGEHGTDPDSLAAAINLIRRAVAGKRDQTIATGVIRVYDTDGTTVLATLTPTEEGGVLTLDDAQP
jgi:hypothetical protein